MDRIRIRAANRVGTFRLGGEKRGTPPPRSFFVDIKDVAFDQSTQFG